MPAMTSESTPLRLRRLIQNQFHTPVGGASLHGIVAGQRPGIGIADGPQARTVDAVGLKIADHTAGASNGELPVGGIATARSEEHTSELQSLMRTTHAGYCLKKQKT